MADWFVSLVAMILAMGAIYVVYPSIPAFRTDPQWFGKPDVLTEQQSSRARYVALEHEAMAHWEKLCNCPDVTRAALEMRQDARMRTCDYAWNAGDVLPSYCLTFAEWLDSQYYLYHGQTDGPDTRPHA